MAIGMNVHRVIASLVRAEGWDLNQGAQLTSVKSYALKLSCAQLARELASPYSNQRMWLLKLLEAARVRYMATGLRQEWTVTYSAGPFGVGCSSSMAMEAKKVVSRDAALVYHVILSVGDGYHDMLIRSSVAPASAQLQSPSDNGSTAYDANMLNPLDDSGGA